MQVNGKIVAVAMSGGVDSSVAAALLIKNGFNVIGLTMHIWDYDAVGGNVFHETSCCSLDNIQDARTVCQQLGIPHYVIDVRKEFEDHVISNFISEYLAGRTPNPCILCNSMIKWTTLFGKARQLKADYLSTGHYAQVFYESQINRYGLMQGADDTKDQSYALWALTQDQLKHTIFPLGEHTKKEVRRIALEMNLKTKLQKESQEICFIQDDDYGRFLRERIPELQKSLQGGEIVDIRGQILGQHRGYPYYTIGQRKGLGIAVGKPLYVIAIDSQYNRIVVGDKDDLESEGVIVDRVNWISGDIPLHAEKYLVKIRYHDEGKMAEVRPMGEDRVQVIFETPHQAVTPGQSAVFYRGRVVIGGGIIDQAIKKC